MRSSTIDWSTLTIHTVLSDVMSKMVEDKYCKKVEWCPFKYISVHDTFFYDFDRENIKKNKKQKNN